MRCGQELCPNWPGMGCVDGVMDDCPSEAPDTDEDTADDVPADLRGRLTQESWVRTALNVLG